MPPDFDGPATFTDFDWADLERLLGELNEAEIPRADLAEVVVRLLDWCTSEGRPASSRQVGEKLLALVWCFGIGATGNRSLRSLARNVDFSRSWLSVLAARMGRRAAGGAVPAARRPNR